MMALKELTDSQTQLNLKEDIPTKFIKATTFCDAEENTLYQQANLIEISISKRNDGDL